MYSAVGCGTSVIIKQRPMSLVQRQEFCYTQSRDDALCGIQNLWLTQQDLSQMRIIRYQGEDVSNTSKLPWQR